MAGCAPDRALGPGDDPSLATIGASSFDLTLTPVSQTQIDVTWKDASSSESGYELWRSTTGPIGTFIVLATTGSNVTSFSDLGLTAVTEYCYRVRLFKRVGRKTSYSAFSSTSCVTTPAPPPPPPGPIAPSALNARPFRSSNNPVEITWNDNSSDEEGFRLERAASDQGPWESAGTRVPNSTTTYEWNRPVEQRLCYRVIAFRGQSESASNVDCTYIPAPPTALTIAAITAQQVDLTWTDNSSYEESFVVQRSIAGGSFTDIATVGADVTTFRDVTISADETYRYIVSVTHEGVLTGSTNTLKVIFATAPPLAPSGLHAAPNNSTSISGSWWDNSANEEGFRVERSENGGATWVEIARLAQPGFFDGDLVSDRQLCYRAIAFNSAGESPPSNVACTASPTAPTNLVAATAPGLAIDLTWTDNSSAEDSYVVQRWFEGCTGEGYYQYCYQYYAVVATLGPNVTSYRDASLNPGQHYRYVVNAVRDGGYSDYSNEAGEYPDFPPAVASNLTAVAVTSTRIDLAWNDNSTDENNFHIARCTGTEAACGDNDFAGLGGTPPNVATFSDTSVQPNTTYTYRVLSCSYYRCAAPSNKASATTSP